MKPLRLAEILRFDDLSLQTADEAPARLQKEMPFTGFVFGDVQAQISLTSETAKYLNWYRKIPP